MTDHQTGTVASGDVNVFYRLFGEPGATPILIFHGANYYDSADWIEVAAALATDRQVAALDMRGFGETGWSAAKNYSLDAHMEDANAILDHLGWDKVIPMGHSMGGGKTVLFASRFAARTDRLIIVDHCPGSGGGLERALKQAVGKPATVFATFEAAQEAMSRDRNTPPGSAALARIESFLRPVAGGFVFPRDPDFGNPVPLDAGDGWAPEIVVEDYWAELARVRVPTVIIRGTQSDRYKPDAIARVAKEFPNILMIDVNSGHDVPGGARDELIAGVKRFLAEHMAAAVA